MPIGRVHAPMALHVPAQTRRYIGRFAPSPTGPLHFGSLVAALASFLDARAHNGDWLLRIEDLDPPREDPESGDAICRTLERYGMLWDREVLWQSTRHTAYADALERLQTAGHLFACRCSRRQAGHIYPGHCRDLALQDGTDRTLRLRVPDRTVSCHDRLQGRFSQQLAEHVGDFIVRRRDGLYAYQLAVVVDDHQQQITDVVRGIDLLESTPRQCLLQDLLGLPRPRHAHLPVVVGDDGDKLSKQTFAAPVDAAPPGPLLFAALQLLGQSPPTELHDAPPQELLDWACAHWQPDMLKGRKTLPLPTAVRELLARQTLL